MDNEFVVIGDTGFKGKLIVMEFIALGHNYSLNHRGKSGIEVGQIMGSGGINSSEEEEEVQDSVNTSYGCDPRTRTNIRGHFRVTTKNTTS